MCDHCCGFAIITNKEQTNNVNEHKCRYVAVIKSIPVDGANTAPLKA